VATGGQCEIGVGPGRPGEEGRRSADPQVLHPQRGRELRQDGDFHAEATRGRQRLGYARAPVVAEGGYRAVRRRQVRRSLRPSRSTTSAASSSTPRRSTRSPIRARTPTSAWCRASKLR
jgi:hypothetical protein